MNSNFIWGLAIGAGIVFVAFYWGNLADLSDWGVCVSRGEQAETTMLCLRSWASSLSGWAAAIVTGIVGWTTIKPLLRQIDQQNDLALLEYLEAERTAIEAWNGSIDAFMQFLVREYRYTIDPKYSENPEFCDRAVGLFDKFIIGGRERLAHATAMTCDYQALADAYEELQALMGVILYPGQVGDTEESYRLLQQGWPKIERLILVIRNSNNASLEAILHAIHQKKSRLSVKSI